MTDRDAARTAKEHLRADLSRLPGVNGIGIGRRAGTYVVTVTVTEQTVRAQVPTSYDGVPVEVRVAGVVRALPVTADAAAGDASEVGGPVRTGVDPIGVDPVSGDPVSGDPVSGDPVSGDPVSGDPVSGARPGGCAGEPRRDPPGGIRTQTPSALPSAPTDEGAPAR